jgi:hypothetical protein
MSLKILLFINLKTKKKWDTEVYECFTVNNNNFTNFKDFHDCPRIEGTTGPGHPPRIDHSAVFWSRVALNLNKPLTAACFGVQCAVWY